MNNNQAPKDYSQRKDMRKEKHSKKFYFCFITLMSIAVLGSIVFYLKIHYSPKQCVNQFIQAIETKDYTVLKRLIHCEDVEVTDETLEPLVLLYQTDQQFRKDIRNTLNKNLNQVDLDTYNTDSWIQLISHRKFLIQTYTISIVPVRMKFSSNVAPINITYNNQIQVLEQDSFLESPFLLPGLYQIKAVYLDPLRKIEIPNVQTIPIYCDREIPIQFECSRLVLTLPEGYITDTMAIDEVDISNLVFGKQDKFILDPVFPNSVITLSSKNAWNRIETTTFSIPDHFEGDDYEYYCDFNSTSMEFVYQPGLTVTELSINSNVIEDYEAYLDSDQCSITLSALTIGTTIEIHLTAPWNENFIYSYTVSFNDFDKYTHNIHCKLSEHTKSSLISFAKEHYLSLFQMLNHHDLDSLSKYAEYDEMANDFYIMLENINYDYEIYSNEFDGYNEDIQINPQDVNLDQYQLNYYSEPFVVPINGFVQTISTSTDFTTLSPIVEEGTNHYNVILYISYDSSTNQWFVNESYYNYDTSVLKDSVNILNYE